jgi:hypothetical protein
MEYKFKELKPELQELEDYVYWFSTSEPTQEEIMLAIDNLETEKEIHLATFKTYNPKTREEDFFSLEENDTLDHNDFETLQKLDDFREADLTYIIYTLKEDY